MKAPGVPELKSVCPLAIRKIGASAADFGEDIYFCRRWAETGNFCWVDSDITFTHRGGKAWKGNFFDHCIKSGVLRMPKAEAA